MNSFHLRLYVSGRSTCTEQAILNLKRICDEAMPGGYAMDVVDVLLHPQMAEDEKILATPTLIKQVPPPVRRVIGDFSDREKVLLALGLRPTPRVVVT
jgi:circadian clock protein KaiB